jgi:nucleotide-binding universal stress UspA family protein
MVAPRGFAGRGKLSRGPVGVAYDGRPEARAALRPAVDLAIALRRPLRLIAVASLDPHDPLNGRLPLLREDLEGVLAEAAAELAPRVDHHEELLSGDVASVLVMRSNGLGILVVGSRGRGPLLHAVLGGVSSAVTRGAACPVLVAPRAAAREPATAR